MTQEEALRMALEALEADELDMVDDGSGNMVFRKEQAITAIKEALAQTQEPVAWEQFYPDIGKPQIAEALAKEKALQALHDENERLGLYKDAYAEQEPMAWISTGPARMIHWTSDKPAYGDDWVPLYTTPPQRMAKRIEDLETEQDCVGWFGYDTGLRLWFETNKGDDGAIPLYKRRRTHD